jgi:predicted HTH transcriptional regulator
MRFKIQVTTEASVTLIERDCAYGQLANVLREMANTIDSPTAMSETRQCIFEFMRNSGPTTPHLITKATGIGRANVQQHLKRMMKAQTVRRLNYGRYEVV